MRRSELYVGRALFGLVVGIVALSHVSAAAEESLLAATFKAEASSTHDEKSTDDRPATPARPMQNWQAAVLGVVEGVTEYLPVSSTGHLILTQRAMGLGVEQGDAKDAADAFAVCIQAGAILAVLGLYWRHVVRMLAGLVGRDPEGLRLAGHVVAGVLPAVVVGLAAEKRIKRWLFGGEEYGLWPIVAAWIVGGVAILAVSHWRRRKQAATGSANAERAGRELVDLTWPRAMGIGFLQCLAMWPGVSRSLMTIVGGMLFGLRLPAAVEFSFLLGVVTLGGATAKDAVEFGPLMLDHYGATPLIIGAATATLSAALAVRWLVGYLNRRGLQMFGYYRVALGLGVGWLLWRGIL